MVEKLIINDDCFSLYLIPVTPHEEWVNFRVKSVKKVGKRFLRSRLAYSRLQKRLSRTKSTKSFLEKNPEGLLRVTALIEQAIEDGLV